MMMRGSGRVVGDLRIWGWGFEWGGIGEGWSVRGRETGWFWVDFQGMDDLVV